MDWESIKTEYVTTDVKLEELASKYKVSLSTIGRHSSAEHWVKEREKYKKSVQNKCKTKMSNKAVKKETNKLSNLITASDILAGKILKRVERIDIESPVDIKELKDLVSCIKDLTPTMRSLNNIRTVQEIEARQLALDRLELERLKADIDKGRIDEINILFDGEAMNYGE